MHNYVWAIIFTFLQTCFFSKTNNAKIIPLIIFHINIIISVEVFDKIFKAFTGAFIFASNIKGMARRNNSVSALFSTPHPDEVDCKVYETLVYKNESGHGENPRNT